MAFKIEDLERMTGSGAGFALWGYLTLDDDLATVMKPGYLDGARDLLRADDWLFIKASDECTVKLTDATEIGTPND